MAVHFSPQIGIKMYIHGSPVPPLNPPAALLVLGRSTDFMISCNLSLPNLLINRP